MHVGSQSGEAGLPKLDANGDQVIAPVPRISIQVFCEGAELAAVIQEAMNDRRMDKAQVKVHMGGPAAAVEAYRNAPTPNVIVLESTGDRAALVRYLDELAEFCDAGTKVVVCGKINDILLYRALIARGVSDYLVQPIGVLDFIRSVSHLYANPAAAPIGRTIAVVGAKGGVGASTIAHNIGWAIARNLEIATVVVDFDLGFGTAGLDFNQDPPQGIADVVFAPERLDLNLVDRLLSKCTQNLSLLAAPATLDRMYDFHEGAFDPLIDVLRSSVPCIILDIPHAWTGWTRRLLVGADELVLVAGPDLANLRNTKNLIDALRAARPNDSRPRLVINGTGVLKRPEISVADFAKAVELTPAAVIPFEAKLFGTAANNGQMIAEVEPGSKVAELLGDLAQSVTGRAEVPKAKRTLLEPFMSRLSRKKA
jgi:pilus assembly protein CpaE